MPRCWEKWGIELSQESRQAPVPKPGEMLTSHALLLVSAILRVCVCVFSKGEARPGGKHIDFINTASLPFKRTCQGRGANMTRSQRRASGNDQKPRLFLCNVAHFRTFDCTNGSRNASGLFFLLRFGRKHGSTHSDKRLRVPDAAAGQNAASLLCLDS